jgi:steroid 5-alpha reductase family enzyme
MDFWLPVVVVFISNTVFFVFCQIKADNGYIDVFWGLLFVFPMIALAIKDRAFGYDF